MSNPRVLAALTLAVATFAAPLPAIAQDGRAGPYLAARAAVANYDYRAAAEYYSAALARDPSNPELLANAVLAQLGGGNFDAALTIARSMVEAGTADQIARMVDVAGLIDAGDFAAVHEAVADGRQIGPTVDALLAAWSEVALGRFSDAQARFDALSTEPGQQVFGAYHNAMALAMVGDFEGADELLSGRSGTVLPATRRGIIAHAQVLSQLGRNDDARDLIEKSFGPAADPGLAAMVAALDAGETLAFDVITTPAEGMAEVFLTVAGVLNGESSDTYTLMYARVAEHLRPNDTDARLMVAGILEAQGQHALASEAYAAVPTDDPLFHIAEIGRADTLFAAGRQEAAVEVLAQLSRSRADLPVVHIALGDLLRRLERHDEASVAYDRAIELLGPPQPGHWPYYYARGITHEREGRWDAAERDLRQALALSPDQPQVLNYLGYSFVDKGENLVEALDMIERAVAARPNDGYIIDSLAWAYYRLGRYDEAIGPMERAASLTPTDPIVNDHLGDVLWAVGRKREAEFQWRRALSFDPEPDEAARIRRKIEVGLDRVLEEEGAPPLRAVDAAASAN